MSDDSSRHTPRAGGRLPSSDGENEQDGGSEGSEEEGDVVQGNG